MVINWVDGFTIKVSMEGNNVLISANKEGLLSLANQLKTLADEESSTHCHYDEYNSLEEGSCEMIIEKIG